MDVREVARIQRGVPAAVRVLALVGRHGLTLPPTLLKLPGRRGAARVRPSTRWPRQSEPAVDANPDVDQDSPRTGQVVIRDRAIIDYLVSRGVIEERFGQRTVDKRDYLRGFGYQGSVGREGWAREISGNEHRRRV
jgi:hypothetical protein